MLAAEILQRADVILTDSPSPPPHISSVGSPAVTSAGTWVKAMLDWAKAATAKEAPRKRALEKYIMVVELDPLKANVE